MIVKRRCNECGSSFYTNTAAPTDYCQDCTGGHDNIEQKITDQKLIQQATASPEGPPQSVDPRALTEVAKKPRKRKTDTHEA